MKRGYYGQLIFESDDTESRNKVNELVLRIAIADKVDEHGAWDFGAEFDSKGRGHALNWNAYAVGHDMHSGDFLAIIQVRQWSKTRRRGFVNIRKSYFLIGSNEDNSVFAHPVSAHVIHRAIKDGRDPILAVQDWIFGGDYAAMIRQGDLALLPMSKRPAGTKGQLRKVAILQDSHELRASQIASVDDRIYARNPQLTHKPGVHAAIEGIGWHQVIVGQRGRFWSFAAPTID